MQDPPRPCPGFVMSIEWRPRHELRQGQGGRTDPLRFPSRSANLCACWRLRLATTTRLSKTLASSSQMALPTAPYQPSTSTVLSPPDLFISSLVCKTTSSSVAGRFGHRSPVAYPRRLPTVTCWPNTAHSNATFTRSGRIAQPENQMTCSTIERTAPATMSPGNH